MMVASTTGSMSSLEIAELTGKRHDNVLADIRKMLAETKSPENNEEYRDARGRMQPCLVVTKSTARLLLDKYVGLARVPNRLQEEAALKTIEQLLGVTLTRQYKVYKYRVDGYDEANNVAYEIDEPQHYVGGALRTECVHRQQAIEGLLGCKVVRIRV